MTAVLNPTVRLITTLSHLIRRKVDCQEHLKELTPAQDRMLHYILSQCEERDLFQKEIEEAFNLRRSTASEMLTLMEQKGLIIRERWASDARIRQIVPTKKGWSLKERVLQDVKEMEKLVTRGVTDEEIELFLRIGEKMMENLK